MSGQLDRRTAPQETPGRAIHPGQVYESCQPTVIVDGVETHTRICVLGEPADRWLHGYSKVSVATIDENHRPLRPRLIKTSQLHASGTTRAGQPRRTGYRLITGGTS